MGQTAFHPHLEMRGISKTFPGVKALDDVHFSAHMGEVHALLGENGAGKSTLMKILSGALRADSGDIFIEGKPHFFSSTKGAEEAGISIIYQELNLIPQMTAAENIYLGREPKNRLGIIRNGKMKEDAANELRRLDADFLPDIPVGQLDIGQQQLVEIAKALSLHSKILIMDEPTSSLNDKEVEVLFKVIQRLKQSGVAIIYITHKLDEIFTVAQKVTVLRDGCFIGTKEIDECDSTSLVDLMVGRKIEDMFPKEKVSLREEIFRVANLSVEHPSLRERNLLNDISFSLDGGEILGLAGLRGSGRSELLMTLFGVPPGSMTCGKFFIHNGERQIKSPEDTGTLSTAIREIQYVYRKSQPSCKILAFAAKPGK
jgi:ribose transport system ATP-binding protein